MSGLFVVNRRQPSVHIGDADGRIALWLNEQSARDIATQFPYPDIGGAEILAAIQKAYPHPEVAADTSEAG